MKKIKNVKGFKPVFWILASAGIIFVLLLGTILLVYRSDSQNKVMTLLERIIPFPAVYVKGAGLVSMGEVKGDNQAVKKFYESQEFGEIGMRVDFSTDQGKKRLKVKEKDILNKLIENRVIEALAQKRNIDINDAAVDQEVDLSIEQFGNRQNLMSELARLYGWTLEDFKQKVVKPELYSEKLSDAYSTEIDTSKEQAKIKMLHERVTAKKEDFAKVAEEASEGDSSKNGGDLGWSDQTQLIPEVAEKAFSMKIGEVSDIIASPLGYHIIKLDEKKTDSEIDLVRLRQIFVKIPTFGDWLKEQMKKNIVVMFLDDYRWNAGEAQIEFKNEDLRRFEADLAANSQGDPSVFP